MDGGRVERFLVAPVLAGAVVAFCTDERARDAADQARGPFLLVAGLLMLGLVADRDGLFAWASARLLGVTDHPRRLLAVALALVAVVTALLNLDTAVVFLTPVLIGAARGAGVEEGPFLYGSVLMANASSLLLPGANLTNLLVLASEPVSGATFVARVLPGALAAAVVTALGLMAWQGRHPRCDGGNDARDRAPAKAERPRPLSVVACAIAAVLVLVLPDPSLPVLAVGVIAVLVRRVEGDAVAEAVGPLALLGLFSVSVLLGALARTWSGPAELLASASPLETTAIGACAAILVNNLPAAVLLSAAPPPHPRALLFGLNLGPNLAVTGSLSAYLWFKAARSAGAEPSALRFSLIGAPLALVAMAAALLTGTR
ncbi:SLC13 family permease [Baekduia sp. Peel2402]|uniref:SLC13 family permease n=1 Tax=Baekduia sp. Peel2402 TaxID=3458296 RepID=UPI00403EAA8B